MSDIYVSEASDTFFPRKLGHVQVLECFSEPETLHVIDFVRVCTTHILNPCICVVD